MSVSACADDLYGTRVRSMPAAAFSDEASETRRATSFPASASAEFASMATASSATWPLSVSAADTMAS